MTLARLQSGSYELGDPEALATEVILCDVISCDSTAPVALSGPGAGYPDERGWSTYGLGRVHFCPEHNPERR